MNYMEFSNVVTFMVALGGGFAGIYLLFKSLGFLPKGKNGNGECAGTAAGYVSTRCPFYGTELIALVQTNEKVVSALEQQNKRLDDIVTHIDQIPIINERIAALQRKVENLD